MTFSTQTSRFFAILISIVLMLGLTAQISQVTATPQLEETSSTEAPYYFSLDDLSGLPGMDEVLAEAEANIRIKIVIIIVIRKKGVAEITDIRPFASDGGLGTTRIVADAEVRNGRLYIKPIEADLDGEEITKLVVREGFRVRPRVAQQLGWNDTMMLRRGSMDFRVNQLGNFEIQD